MVVATVVDGYNFVAAVGGIFSEDLYDSTKSSRTIIKTQTINKTPPTMATVVSAVAATATKVMTATKKNNTMVAVTVVDGFKSFAVVGGILGGGLFHTTAIAVIAIMTATTQN